jgi:hypothetical protein
VFPGVPAGVLRADIPLKGHLVFGRSCACLLAFSFLIPLPAAVDGQSDRADPGRDFTFPRLPPATVQPPVPHPVQPYFRRRWLTPPGTFGLPQLARAAGTIFSGTVTAINRRPANAGQSVETVAVTFHVEQAIRGVIPREDLTISQWIGLWSGGQRYRLGERVLLFLYPPSKLGLTSCVGGGIGRFAIDARGRVVLSAQHLSVFQTDPVLGGRSRVRLSDFAWAVRRASEEESVP